MQSNKAQPADMRAEIPQPMAHWLPLVILAALVALAYGIGLPQYFSLQSMAEHQAALQSFVMAHLLEAIVIYFFAYVAVVALSLPGAGVLSIAGGFALGWAISAPVTVVAATLGAMIVFKVVQTSLGVTLAERAGPLVQKIARGFEEDGFNYLLFLRLVPVFPFFAINAAAGLTSMSLRSFTIATFIGIIPGSYAFAFLGRGLGSVLDAARERHAACVAQDAAAACPSDISLSALMTPQILWASCALGLVALLPVAIKKWNKTDHDP